MNKKAYTRTIEVLIAVIITMLFIYFVFPKSQTPTEQASLGILKVLENNPTFRNCAISTEYSCVKSYLKDYVPKNYEYVFDISENTDKIK